MWTTTLKPVRRRTFQHVFFQISFSNFKPSALLPDAMGDDNDENVDEVADEVAAQLFEKLMFDQVKKLGQGGMGIAYRARSLKDGTTRVLKVNLRQASDDDDAQALLEEGQLLKSFLGLDSLKVC